MDAGYRMCDPGWRMRDAGCWMLDIHYSTFAFNKVCFSIKLAAFPASGIAET
jgi:hypothetical protein